jgi:hypothetical protein
VEQFGDSFAPDRRDDAKFGKVSPDRIDDRGLLASKQMPCGEASGSSAAQASWWAQTDPQGHLAARAGKNEGRPSLAS